MSLTPTQRWAIAADLAAIREIGFNHIRVLTFTKAKDPLYDPWPQANFLTFPVPTADELTNLAEFLNMTKTFGMTCEVVFLMPDHFNMYYQNGVTSADYRAFITALWNNSIWYGALSKIYLGGDLRLGDHDDPVIVANHRQWISDLWPFLVSLCPGCGLGMEVQAQHASFWDRGADSLAWIRANLTARPPTFVGAPLYPTSHAALRALGFENAVGVVDWTALTRDWVINMRAAAGPITVYADEVGLIVGPEFTAMDQATFLAAAYRVFTARKMMANVWEFGDHSAIGDFGLLTTDRVYRAASRTVKAPLAGARSVHLQPGIQYIPPEYADLAWLMPE